MAEKTRKPGRPRWKGALEGYSLAVRLLTAGMLVVVCAALVFTQLGFADIGVEGDFSAYALVILMPIALAALLLGVFFGAAIGCVAGAMQLFHASMLPLDHYELSFITPVTSVVMLSVMGLLLGFMFAIALRKEPSGVKVVVYIVLICFVASMLYSVGFFVNVMAQLTMDALAGVNLDAVDSATLNASLQEDMMKMALRAGDTGVQALADVFLMAVPSIVAEFVVRRHRRRQAKPGLRSVFGTRMSLVVMVAFLIVSGATFVSITEGELARAEKDMRGEVGYLCNQLNASNDRNTAIADLLEESNIDFMGADAETLDNIVRSVSIEGLLDGYSEQGSGFLFVTIDDTVPGDDTASVDGSASGGGTVPGDGTVPGGDTASGDDTASGESAASKEGDSVGFGADSWITLSNDGRFPKGVRIGDIVDDEVILAIRKSGEADKMQRFVLDAMPSSDLLDDYSSLSDLPEGEESYIAYTFAKSTDNYTVVEIRSSQDVFESRSSIMGWSAVSSFVLLLAVFGMVALLLNRVVARRIDQTNAVLGCVAEGDLDARVDVRDTREFDSLSDGINDTVGALKGWIAEAETRMDAELATAKAIQEAALPRTFPPYPDIRRFDVYASMHAAKEVGGDFYDFFLIGADAGPEAGRLGFVIADVSGKGVPAALFMMKAMTQIRDYLESGMEVGEAVENANRQLCQGNDAGMFVTAWVGVLDYASGHVDYVNAGHNPPLLWQQEGGWRWLTEKSGLPLGLFDGFPYQAYSLDCGIGDQLLLYTDGVTEAMSQDGELYGEARLEALVQANYTYHPRRLVEAVRRDVAAHARDAEQSDDITVLALEVGVPPEVTAMLVVPADTAELPRVNEFIHAELDRRLCPLRAQSQLDIAVEELFVNVCHYAYPDSTPDNPGTARIGYTYSADPPSVTVTIADDGIPYDPLAKPDAVTPDDIMDVPIGGLGILMAKRSVDSMSYERMDGSNVVTLVKKW